MLLVSAYSGYYFECNNWNHMLCPELFSGTLGPALGLLAITLVGCSHYWNLIFLTLAVTSNGAVYAGFQCNHIDIAPKFAGLYSFSSLNLLLEIH